MISINCCYNMQLDAYIPQEDIGKVYDGKAAIYDSWAYLTESKARDRAIELSQISNGASILEVAVGTGLLFENIVRKNPEGKNIGIDISEGMLKKAELRLSKLNIPSYSLMKSSAYEIPVESDSVDILFNNYMFDLIPYAGFDKVLSEFLRVLKPGGRLVMVNMTKPQSILSGMYELIYKISPKTMGGCRGVMLEDYLLENKFEVMSREYCEQMFFPSEIISAIKPA